MIELSVKEYCQECPDFDAKVTVKNDDVYQYGNETPIRICNTTVTCKHAKRCEGIKRYLERINRED